jgi:hypothetical protein
MDTCKEPQICVICQKKRKDVLSILDKAVCTDCEQKIVGVRVSDLSYDFFVARLKKIGHTRGWDLDGRS